MQQSTIEKHLKYAIEILSPKYNFPLPKSKSNWQEDWYKLQQKHFLETSGNGLLRGSYGGSPLKFLQSVFPDIKWLPWKMAQTPQGFWRKDDIKQLENIRFYMNWLKNILGYKSLDDFYKISIKDFKENYGGRLTKIYNDTPLNILKDTYPEKKWYGFLFNYTTRGIYDTDEGRKEIIQYIEEKENITNESDWYKYDGNIFTKYNVSGLLANQFKSSISALLKSVYPDYPWKMYLFTKTPHQYWQNKDNRLKYLNDFIVFKKYSINDHLYKARYEDFVEFHGRGILDMYNSSYIHLIMDTIDYTWDIKGFLKGGCSQIALKWIRSLEIRDSCSYQHAESEEGEYRIPGKRWHVDGHLRGSIKIKEFLGGYWHGDPRKYPSEQINPSTKTTYGYLYEKTFERFNELQRMGYEIEYIWQDDYEKGLSSTILYPI